MNTHRSDSKQIFIYIESIECGMAKGVFYNPHLKKAVSFSCLDDMILKIDKFLKNMKNPYLNRYPLSLKELGITWAVKYFFVLEIRYEQHYSWQGTLKGRGLSKNQCFKSVLDLMKQLNGAMDISG